LESLGDYDAMKDGFNVIALIKAIKGITYQFEWGKYHSQALHKAKKQLNMIYQTKDMSDTMFLENFQTLVSVVEKYGGGS
jgi:hypothetical protein